jgi:VanZ family protein
VPRKMRWLRNWGPVILWAAAISGFSTSAFGSEHTSRFILPVLKWILPNASADTLAEIHHLIRKAGHLTEYFIFGLLALRAIRAGRREWLWKWAGWALFLSAVMASLDEYHQSFVPGRTASPWDSALDTCGAAIGLCVAWVVITRRNRKIETSDI